MVGNLPSTPFPKGLYIEPTLFGSMGIDKSTGYNYLYKPNHPNSKKNGMIAEHTFILSQLLGRPLRKNEQCHHKDGNKLNNESINLELVTITEHYYKHRNKRIERKCIVCSKKTLNGKFCSMVCCHINQRKVARPSKQKLIKLIKEHNYCYVGRLFGVSDNSIRKWLK